MPRARAANRTDLAGKEPVTTAPGQTYGKQTAQAQSQKVMPIAAPPVAAPAATPVQAPGSTAAPAPVAPDIAGMLANGLGGHSPAGSLKFLHPTERPNVPVTNGLPTGPGAGPEALTGLAAQAASALASQGNVRDTLAKMASAPGSSSTVKQLLANS